MSFNLPNEIQDLIIQHLPLQALYNLTLVSRSFAHKCFPHLSAYALSREHCQHALYYAALTRNEPLTRTLLSRGRGDISVYEHTTRIFSYKTFWKPTEREHAIQVLLRDGANAGIHSYAIEGYSCLHNTDLSGGKEYLRRGAYAIDKDNPISRFEYGPRTALEFAAEHGRLHLLTRLLSDSSTRPTHIDIKLLETLASRCTGPELARVVSRITQRDSTGATMLHRFVRERNEGMVRVLIKYGADLNCEDDEGVTPVSRECDLEWVVRVALDHFMIGCQREWRVRRCLQRTLEVVYREKVLGG